MKAFLAFLSKEFLEQVRNYKLLILLSVFGLCGLMSAPLAKFMPEIFASLAIDGIVIEIPTPTFVDAYSQFFKNVSQMALIALVLVFGGGLSQELSKGTLTNMLSKGLSRNSVIMAKYLSALALFTASYFLALTVHVLYTLYFFGSHSIGSVVFSSLCLWLFGAFLLSLIQLFGALTKGSYAPLLLTAAAFGLLSLLGMLPHSNLYNPIALSSVNTALVAGILPASEILLCFFLTIGYTAAVLIASLLIFQKKQV